MIKRITLPRMNALKLLAVAVAFFGFSTANAQYCTPGMNCNDGDLILNVTFSGIANPSDCSANGYGDYTATVDPAEVEAGQTYTMDVEVGGGWGFETVGIWIDFDNSQSFEPSEFYLLGTGTASTVSADVLIPVGTAIGDYRMRISVLASDVPVDDPCYNDPGNFGEFEDYLISVFDPLSTADLDFSNSVVVFNSAAGLNVKAGEMISQVNVFDISGKLIATQHNVNALNTVVTLSASNQIVLVIVQSVEGYTITKKVVL